jgi:hypothetical protein
MQTTPRNTRKFLSKRLSVGLLSLLPVVLLVLAGKRFFSPVPWGSYAILSTAHWARLNSPGYVWLKNGDLAHLEKNVAGRFQICYQKVDVKGSVNANRNGPELPANIYPDEFCPSPDEHWIACLRLPDPSFYKSIIVSADGKTSFSLFATFLAWMPDSHSFVTCGLTSPGPLTVRHFGARRTETIPGLTPSDAPMPLRSLPEGPNFYVVTHVVPPVAIVRSFPISNPGTVQQSWKVSGPPDADVGSVTASPDNMRLLWVVYTTKPSRWSAWLHRLLPSVQSDPEPKVSYFLSDVHGDAMHPILNFFVCEPGGLPPLWTPDSKHLSFLYKEQLYLIEVD